MGTAGQPAREETSPSRAFPPNFKAEGLGIYSPWRYSVARARNIKPSFFQNEDLAELDPLARLFFIGLWTVADFKGCVEFRPKRLKVQLLPYDNCDTERLGKNLESSGFVRIYSVDGQRYLKIVNFEKHQNPHKNERDSGSEIPDVDKADAQVVESIELTNYRDKDGTAQECNGTAPADSLLLIPDSPFPITAESAPAASRKKPPRFNMLLALCERGVSDRRATEFLEVRKAKRAVNTQTALDGIVREAGKAGISVDDAVRICIEKGWQGFDASWNWQADTTKKTQRQINDEATAHALFGSPRQAAEKVITGDVVQ